MTSKKNKQSGELTLEELKDITVGSDVNPDSDNSGACDIHRPADCD